MKLQKLNRWGRKLCFVLAAFPVLQATTCDPQTTANSLVSTALSLGAQLNLQIAQLAVSGAHQSLLLNFPGANILQILLGANRIPFFP